VLLAIGAIFIATWLYAIRGGNPYGGGTHLLLAAGIVAFVLHMVRSQKRNPRQSMEPSVGEHRASSTLLNPRCLADVKDHSDPNRPK
jgi:hypothetical protein